MNNSVRFKILFSSFSDRLLQLKQKLKPSMSIALTLSLPGVTSMHINSSYNFNTFSSRQVMMRFKVVLQRCEQTRNVLVILSHKLKRLPVRQAVFTLVSSRGWMRTFPDHVRVLTIVLSLF